MTDQPGWSAPGGAAPEQGPPPSTPGRGQPSYGQPSYGQPSYGGPAPGGWGAPTPGPGWGPRPPGPPPPPRPGVIPLRPLGIGEILDGSISTMRAHPRAMLGLSLLVAVVVQLLTVPLTWLLLRDNEISFSFDPEEQPTAEEQLGEQLELLASTSVVSVIQVIVTLIAVLFLTGVLTAVVSRAVLGEPITIGDAWRQARPRLKTMFAVTIVVLLLQIATIAVTLGPGILLAVLDAPTAVTVLLLVLGAIAYIVVGVYLYVIFALAPSIVVLERAGVMGSLRRSRALVKGAWWRTFSLLSLIFVIAYVISLVLAFPFSFGAMVAAYLAGDGDHLKMFAAVPLAITGIGGILTSAVTWPFTATGTVLVYVDRRIRREGLDLELARAAGLTPGADGASVASPSPSGTYQG